MTHKALTLTELIWYDLTRNLLRVLLYLSTVLSAFLVIQYAHNHRQLSIEQEKLIKERDQLDIEWRHIVLEQSALTEHNRIENTVREKLGMIRPDPEDEVVVKIQ